MDLQIKKIKTVLKEQLKKNKMTYEGLAEELEVSVPTIKRWMSPEHDLGLQDLLSICDVIKLNLSDLHTLSAKIDEGKKQATLSEEQQKFLVKNLNYLAYFIRIHDGKTPQEIAEKYKLTQTSTDKYLVRLEKLGMIKVTGKLRVKSAFEGAHVDFGDGVLAKTYIRQWIQGSSDFFADVISNAILTEKSLDPNIRKHKTEATYAIQTVKLTRESYLKWAQQNAAAISELTAIGKIEEKAFESDKLFTAIILNSHTSLPQDSKFLEKLDSMVGEIVNI